jgi:hypothetical protein
MPEVFSLPYEFVDHLLAPGLPSSAGSIPLLQYLCKTQSNGGNDNAHNLFKELRWMKNGAGVSLNTLVGGGRIDVMIKGQGHPDDFVKVWDFMIQNKNKLTSIKMNVVHRAKGNSGTAVVDKTGNIHDLYFKGRDNASAIKAMIADKFFGIDCIGFVANYLIHVGVWSKYKGYAISQWDNVFTQKVQSINDVQALNILLWDGHIAIVDWVLETLPDKTLKIDVCQSSGVGPQFNGGVYLKETTQKNGHGRRLYKIYGGQPAVPVGGYVYIMQMKGLFY